MKLRTLFVCLLATALGAATSLAQTPAVQLRGTITDESSAAIPGATVTVTGQGTTKTFSTNELGVYTASGLPAGKYTVHITSVGFAAAQKAGVEIGPAKTLTLDVQLKIAAGKQEVTVSADTNTVSTDAASNAGAIILREADLAALSDDPDDLEADLQALAGPSAGPNGGQIFIDGFSNGKLPPKSSIREVRINQNPFSAEYDRLGYGRIEVFTKPGTDRYRGQAFFSDSNNVFNARNPFSDNKADFQSRSFGGNISGPISKKSSFFVDVERRMIDDNALIKATMLDAGLNPVAISQSVVTPQRMTVVSPRIDYQITPRNTIVGRYTWSQNSRQNDGVGSFSLPTLAYNDDFTNHNVQLTETAMLSARVVNETRFQFFRTSRNSYGDNTVPTINVIDAFTGGGSQVGQAWNTNNRWEVQNNTSWTAGRHAFRAGARVRLSSQSDNSPQNFGGTYTFGGGFAPQLAANNQPILGPDGTAVIGQITSLERYRRTLLLQQAGLSPAAIRLLGGGATQFSIAGGNPLESVTQTDLGVFMQDDWRFRPNLTVNVGLRYETQTNVHDWRDFAPRVGFAWAPGAKNGRQKTVVRGGFGMFYSRFDDNYTLQTGRFNGVNQQQYTVINPDFFPLIPSVGDLGAKQPVTIREKDASLRAPYILQTAIGVERQLPKNSTVSLTFTSSRADHLYRSVAFLDTQAIPQPLAAGDRIYEYQSTGILRQNQLIATFRTALNKNISFNSWYVFNHAKSDTDGVGTFPSNPNNFALDYGRSSIDARHRFVVAGSAATKYNIRISPFIIVSSGAPYNIIAGRDLNGDTIINDRPAFASDPNKPGVVMTPYGLLDPNPAPGSQMIPRNFGQGPGSFTINLRLSKTFGFGESRRATAAAAAGGDMGGPMRGGPGGDRGPGGGGPRGGGGGRGPGGGGGMRMGGGGMGGDSSDHRFNVTLSVMARNVLNHVNPGLPVGNLTSPYFGESLGLGGGFGPGGSAANNRRLEFQLRFAF